MLPVVIVHNAKFRHPAIGDHYLTVAWEHDVPGLPRVEVYLISRRPNPMLRSWIIEADRARVGLSDAAKLAGAGLALDWAAAAVDALILGWHAKQATGMPLPSSPLPQLDSHLIERLAIEGVFDEQLRTIRSATQFDSLQARVDAALRLPKAPIPVP